jgi:hypothetical protein
MKMVQCEITRVGYCILRLKPSCFEKLKSLIEEVLNMNIVGTIEKKKKFLLI